MTAKQNENYYKEGYEIAIENARRLSKIADKSADENEFSIACSLSILAAEEALKASFLLVKHFNKGEPLDDFDKIFKDHKTKHRHLPETSDMFETIVNFLYTEYGMFSYIFEMLDRYAEKIPETERKSIMNFRAILSNFLDKMQNPGEVKVDVEEAKIWWKKADGLKMKGFYVDRVNETWHNPKSLTEKQYKEVQKYTLPIITNSDKIKELLEKSNSK